MTAAVDSSLLSRAIVVWTGWGETSWPARKDSRVADAFGQDEAERLLPLVRQAEAQFYKSDARDTVRDLAKMGEAAAQDFRRTRPDLPTEATESLAWCYTFDYK